VLVFKPAVSASSVGLWRYTDGEDDIETANARMVEMIKKAFKLALYSFLLLNIPYFSMMGFWFSHLCHRFEHKAKFRSYFPRINQVNVRKKQIVLYGV
jgi:hypothetical protein